MVMGGGRHVLVWLERNGGHYYTLGSNCAILSLN